MRVMYLKEITAVTLVALICSATCLPPTSHERTARAKKSKLENRGPPHHHGIIWKKLLPFLQSAFTNAISATIVNWFYPWRVVPYPSGKIGIAQLWGGYGLHGPYARRRRSSGQPSETQGWSTT